MKLHINCSLWVYQDSQNISLTLCRISLFLLNTATLTAFLKPVLWLSDKLNSTWTVGKMKNTFSICIQVGNQYCPVEWQLRWKCPSGFEGRREIELLTRSPNCAAPLRSTLLVSNGSNSFTPLIQQLIRPDSLSLQNNLNFFKKNDSKANQANRTTCSRGDFHSTALAPVPLRGHAI